MSGSYIVSLVLTFTVMMSVEQRITPQFANYTSLVFLPHGVRVLAAWLYRWRSVPYLLPGAVAGHVFLYGGTLDIYLLAGWAVGVTCAPLAFTLLSLAGMDYRPARHRRTHWRDLLFVGAVASAINSSFTTLSYGNDLHEASARFVGDVAGTAICIGLIMLGFRLYDRLRWRG